MQWFAYDRFVSVTRKSIADDVDEGVLLAMHREALCIRDALFDRAEAEAQLGAAAAPYAESQLLKTVAVEVLADALPYKSEEDVKRLVAAVNRDSPGPDVLLTTLFKFSSKERSFSNFLDELYTQHLSTRQAILRMTVDAVFDASIETDGRLAPTAFAQALWKLDPDIPAVYMDNLVADIFEVPLDELMPAVDEKAGVRRVGISGNRVYIHNDTTLSDELSVINRLQRRVLVPYSAVYDKS
jgi:hypothetical protein